jgi:hypothetical protein
LKVGRIPALARLLGLVSVFGALLQISEKFGPVQDFYAIRDIEFLAEPHKITENMRETEFFCDLTYLGAPLNFNEDRPSQRCS